MARIQRTTQKDLQIPGNHNGIITHLQPDILESEAKFALGCITTNKASGDDEISDELFQILKDAAAKVLHSTQQGLQDWKMSISFQSQRRTMSKNVQATAQLHSSHMLAK